MDRPVHLIVPGTPVSVQARGEKLRAWKKKVARIARTLFDTPHPHDEFTVLITHYFNRQPRCDTDNMSKPICDALSHIVYADDRQIVERTARHVPIRRPVVVQGMPPALALALCAGEDFIFIRVMQTRVPSFFFTVSQPLQLRWAG